MKFAPWMPWAGGAAAIVALVGAFHTGATFERARWQAGELKAARDADALALERLDALGAGLMQIDMALAARDAAQKEALYGVRKAIAANRPPSDGCRIDAAAAARLRNVFEAANANRARSVRGGTDGDETRARESDSAPASAGAPE